MKNWKLVSVVKWPLSLKAFHHPSTTTGPRLRLISRSSERYTLYLVVSGSGTKVQLDTDVQWRYSTGIGIDVSRGSGFVMSRSMPWRLSSWKFISIWDLGYSSTKWVICDLNRASYNSQSNKMRIDRIGLPFHRSPLCAKPEVEFPNKMFSHNSNLYSPCLGSIV